jgi:phage shock protein PspC (stress-responsive transcriptional regulator)
MKKTFTINISGIIFNIDDDAFDKLNKYIDHIKLHFRNTEGSDEIINDIESRIAEILQDRLSEEKQVVVLEDINVVIEMMGQPSDFDETEGHEDEGSSDSGKSETYATYRRLYRDPDNRIIGGVAGGIGAYFKVDPLWIRLLFVILTLAPGIGLLLYIILWIVVPEARTTADKLSMRGEPVNVSTIEKSIREELNHIKDKINDLAGDAKDTFKKKSKDLSRNGDPIASFFHGFFRILGRIILIVLGVIFLIVGLSFIISLIGMLTGAGTFYFDDSIRFTFFPPSEMLGLIFDEGSNIPVIKITLLLAIGIPFLMLAVFAIRMIFGLRRNRVFYPAAFNVWIISIILLIVFGVRLARDFREKEQYIERTTAGPMVENVMALQISEHHDKLQWDAFIQGNDWLIVEENDQFRGYGDPELFVQPSVDSLLHIEIHFFARGKDSDRALERTRLINYNYNLMDSVILFDRYFSIEPEGVWRDQEVEVYLQLPVGQHVRFDKEMRRILGFHSNYSRYTMAGNAFLMTEDGLKEVGSGMSRITSSEKVSLIGIFTGLIRPLMAI